MDEVVNPHSDQAADHEDHPQPLEPLQLVSQEYRGEYS